MENQLTVAFHSNEISSLSSSADNNHSHYLSTEHNSNKKILQSTSSNTAINTTTDNTHCTSTNNHHINKLKFEHILSSIDNQDVLLSEITNMTDFTMAIPTEDVQNDYFPLEITFGILQTQDNDLSQVNRKNIIEALAPILERKYTSPIICDFFSQHCHEGQRSQIVIEMFIPTVEKILKYNTVKISQMKILIQKYLVAPYSQNDGLNLLEEFIKQLHGPTMICPLLRVLSNLISLCFSRIYYFFENRKKIYKNNVRNLIEDTRCEAHRTVLSNRQNEKGWFEMFCLNGITCNDDGEMLLLILDKLISCCYRRKRFLLSINKVLPALMTLCAMLDLNALENHANELQLISTLQSTSMGLKIYTEICERLNTLKAIQQKGVGMGMGVDQFIRVIPAPTQPPTTKT
ncbi:unnamed protein product [Rotaria magnacalcarata]|uniref:Uncharacterized protein n=1 Tax=Rotaria magnacalcarata TaxID=392030 RepID=A0A817A2S2_9BILA|nr:unnamed protein product [Rotaria magnacalcarata]